MAGDFASGFNQGFNMMERYQNDTSRNNISQQRANSYSESQKQRGQLINAQVQQIMARIAQMPQELALKQQQASNGSLRDQLMQMNYALNLQKFKLQQQQDLDPNSTKNQSLAAREKKAGFPEPATMPDGSTGTVTFPTPTEMTQQQQIISAAPQMDALLNQIQNGANSFINKPGQFKKYVSALNAAWSGSVTPDQEKTLESAGISQNAITQATETESRLLNVPKVESVFNLTNDLFKPHEGETLDSYKARINALRNGNATRYYQAMFNTTLGFPSGLDGIAQKAQNKYVDDSVAADPAINQGAVPSSSQLPTNNDIDTLASQMGTTTDAVNNAISKLESKGYSKQQAMDYLKNGK